MLILFCCLFFFILLRSLFFFFFFFNDTATTEIYTLSLHDALPISKGFGEFSPAIDRFLKEHLFADIFDSDVLNYQQRELATISALATMPGVEPQLAVHLSMGMNTGLTESGLRQAFDLIEENVSREQAEIARKSLAKIVAAKQKK